MWRERTPGPDSSGAVTASVGQERWGLSGDVRPRHQPRASPQAGLAEERWSQAGGANVPCMNAGGGAAASLMGEWTEGGPVVFEVWTELEKGHGQQCKA